MSYLRILHASPDAPAVDVYANNNLLARNLTYRNFTDYLQVAPGTYNVQVFPAGTRQNPVIDANLDIPANSIFTVAAVGRLADISLLPIRTPKVTVPAGKVNVRFAHLSPDAPKVDVTLPNGTVLFSNVGFQEVTDYIAINPGTYTLQVRLAGTDQVVLTVPNQTLGAGKNFTVYAIGLAAGNPPLQALLPLDGNTYLNP